jgi:hypothetical protein
LRAASKAAARWSRTAKILVTPPVAAAATTAVAAAATATAAAAATTATAAAAAAATAAAAAAVIDTSTRASAPAGGHRDRQHGDRQQLAHMTHMKHQSEFLKRWTMGQ